MKILTIVILFYGFTSAQKTCKSKEKSLEDLNAITKCSVGKNTDSKNKNQLHVSVTTSRKHHLKVHKNKSKRISKNIASFTTNLSKKEIKKAKKFKDVEEVPRFKTCDKFDGAKCFNTEMSKHINKNFYYPIDAVKKNIEGKIWVRFIINKKGEISNLKTLGKKEFKDVAIEIISKLPTFIPAKNKGKNVSVKYSFPIKFSLAD